MVLVAAFFICNIMSGYAQFKKFPSLICFDAACPESSPKSTPPHRAICKFRAYLFPLYAERKCILTVEGIIY